MSSKGFSIKLEGKDISLDGKSPPQKNIFELDLEYRKNDASAMRQGVMTESELLKRAEETGAWTHEDDIKIDSLSLEIAAMDRQLQEKKMVRKKKMDLAIDLSKKRGKLLNKVGCKTELLSNTAEAMSNDQRMHKFVELCCFKDNDESFFTSRELYETFVQEHPAELSEIYKQGYMFDYKLPEDMEQDWAEVQYVKSLAEEEVKKQEAAAAKKEKKTPKATVKKE